MFELSTQNVLTNHSDRALLLKVKKISLPPFQALTVNIIFFSAIVKGNFLTRVTSKLWFI